MEHFGALTLTLSCPFLKSLEKEIMLHECFLYARIYLCSKKLCDVEENRDCIKN